MERAGIQELILQVASPWGPLPARPCGSTVCWRDPAGIKAGKGNLVRLAGKNNRRRCGGGTSSVQCKRIINRAKRKKHKGGGTMISSLLRPSSPGIPSRSFSSPSPSAPFRPARRANPPAPSPCASSPPPPLQPSSLRNSSMAVWRARSFPPLPSPAPTAALRLSRVLASAARGAPSASWRWRSGDHPQGVATGGDDALEQRRCRISAGRCNG